MGDLVGRAVDSGMSMGFVVCGWQGISFSIRFRTLRVSPGCVLVKQS